MRKPEPKKKTKDNFLGYNDEILEEIAKEFLDTLAPFCNDSFIAEFPTPKALTEDFIRRI